MAQRKLAAIMFSDIVGYTSLLKEDEKKAFEILRKNQRIHKRLIKKFNGRWLKEMESGTLASFSSIIDAVMCALSIQKATTELNIPVRIGLHQGEVIFEKKDVLGDGVNIASRIHSVTEMNDIIISETVYNDIKNKGGLEIGFLGEQVLKGVSKPIGIYKVSCSDESVLDFTIDSGELIRPLSFGRTTIVIGIMVIAMLAFALYYFLPRVINPPSEQDQSVLVLPCVNYTGTDTLDYYLAGMHDAMIGDIGKISALRVISTTTSKTYKDTEKSIPEIASDLGINTVIEPSVMCLGDSVCLRLKAMSAYPEEKQLWIRDFKVEKSQILNLYNMVTKEISDEINAILTPEEEKMLAEYRVVDKEAYDAYLRGQFYWEKLDRDSLQKSLDYFQLAIEKDPEWADPYAGLASAWWMHATFFKILQQSVTLPKVYQYLNKALELDPESAQAHYVKALVTVWTEFDWVKGEEEFLISLELNPNDAMCRIYYSHLLMLLGRLDEAVIQANLALDLDPLKPLILGLYAAVMKADGNDQSAISHLEKALSIDPNDRFASGSLFNMHMNAAYRNGDYEKWNEMWDKKVAGRWNEEGRAAVVNAFHEKRHIAAIEEMFKMNEKYGNDCFMPGSLKAKRYIKLNNYDKAMDCLEKDYEIRDMFMAYIRCELNLHDQLKDNPRYIALLKKMNLPVD